MVTALVGLHADDGISLHEHVLDLDALADVRLLAAGRLGEGGDHLHRLDVARLGLEGGQFVFGQAGVGVDVRQLLARHQPHVDAQFALHGDVGFQAGAVAFVDDDHHAGVREDRRPADDVREMLEDAQALLGHGRRSAGWSSAGG